MDENTRNELRELKKKVKKGYRVSVFLGVSLFLIIFIPVFALTAEMEDYLCISIVIAFLILYTLVLVIKIIPIYENRCKKYEATFKETVVPKVLNECFDTWSFQPEKGYTEEEFLETGIKPHRNILEFKSSDWLEGEYKGVAFRQADLMMTCAADSTSRKSTETIMDGEMLRIHSPKYAERPVFVSTNCDFMRFNMTYKSVELEDREFNFTYEASAEKHEDIFYFLTPPMMERLMELSRIDKGVMFVFNKEYLYVLRDGRKGIFYVNNKGTVEQDVERAYEDMREIQHIIDCMLQKNR